MASSPANVKTSESHLGVGYDGNSGGLIIRQERYRSQITRGGAQSRKRKPEAAVVRAAIRQIDVKVGTKKKFIPPSQRPFMPNWSSASATELTLYAQLVELLTTKAGSSTIRTNKI